jgi:hypothetical protein
VKSIPINLENGRKNKGVELKKRRLLDMFCDVKSATYNKDNEKEHKDKSKIEWEKDDERKKLRVSVIRILLGSCYPLFFSIGVPSKHFNLQCIFRKKLTLLSLSF